MKGDMKGEVLVGTSGYNYRHWWDGVFYPPDVPQREWLEYYTKFFDTVELNVSFYRLPKREVFEGWYRRTPKDFCFVAKGSRFITHVKKLKDCRGPLKLFFGNAKGLKTKLGMVLWQFPPGLHVDRARLEDFCELLKYSKFTRSIRHAFEFRHKSWFCGDIYDLLRSHNLSLCVAHSARWPRDEVSTADFVYLRFHGGEVLYGSDYSEGELKDWASKAKRWLEEGKDIYAYFNNDAYGFAIKNALRFRELLGGSAPKRSL